MTTDADKIRFLAELAGWRDTTLVRGRTLWDHPQLGRNFELPDYPHSLDAIERDLLPLLREKGWDHAMDWDVFKRQYLFRIWKSGDPFAMPSGYDKNPEPASATFEAIFEALHGGEE